MQFAGYLFKKEGIDEETGQYHSLLLWIGSKTHPRFRRWMRFILVVSFVLYMIYYKSNGNDWFDSFIVPTGQVCVSCVTVTVDLKQMLLDTTITDVVAACFTSNRSRMVRFRIIEETWMWLLKNGSIFRIQWQ